MRTEDGMTMTMTLPLSWLHHRKQIFTFCSRQSWKYDDAIYLGFSWGLSETVKTKRWIPEFVLEIVWHRSLSCSRTGCSMCGISIRKSNSTDIYNFLSINCFHSPRNVDRTHVSRRHDICHCTLLPPCWQFSRYTSAAESLATEG